MRPIVYAIWIILLAIIGFAINGGACAIGIAIALLGYAALVRKP